MLHARRDWVSRTLRGSGGQADGKNEALLSRLMGALLKCCDPEVRQQHFIPPKSHRRHRVRRIYNCFWSSGPQSCSWHQRQGLGVHQLLLSRHCSLPFPAPAAHTVAPALHPRNPFLAAPTTLPLLQKNNMSSRQAQQACAECLGLLGAIDPSRIQLDLQPPQTMCRCASLALLDVLYAAGHLHCCRVCKHGHCLCLCCPWISAHLGRSSDSLGCLGCLLALWNWVHFIRVHRALSVHCCCAAPPFQE